jgi:hypothetical protein
MTTDELYAELNERGHFPLVVLTVDDVLEHLEQEETPTTKEKAQMACRFIYNNWSNGGEYMAALEWAVHQINKG